MRVIIDKLETGHLITVQEDDNEKQIAVGKFYAVVTELRKLLDDRQPRVNVEQGN